MANIITLTGPAHCGKSMVRSMFMNAAHSVFRPVLFKKFTTRVSRNNDDDVICVSKIPSQCDIVYEQYGVRYGLKLNELYHCLEKGMTPIVVLNDVRAVEDIRNIFGPQVVSLFIYRRPANYVDFLKEETARANGFSSTKEIEKIAQTRFEKANAIYRIYIENIHIFDNVILNVADRDITQRQVIHIVKKISTMAEGLI